MRWIAIIALIGCSKPADDGPCTCTPGNTGHAQSIARRWAGEAGPMTGDSLLAALRHHRQEVTANLNPRDIKVHDDELRFQIVDFCQPCADWVKDRLTMEEMFPFDKLDDARSAVCMGLVLRDGTTVYGSARPRACR